MDVIILAAGLSTRLSSYTHHLIPKFLINIDNNTGLYYLIHYWNPYAENIYLVIHSKFNLITNFYIHQLLLDYEHKIKIINYDNSDGTAYTLSYLLNNQLKNIGCNHLLITWCDLYPMEKINFEKLNKNKNPNNIFIFTHGNKCRYHLNNENKIEKKPELNGNIIGIYYFQNYKQFNLDLPKSIENDIVDYLEKIGNINNYNLESMVDYGDMEKINKIIFSPKKQSLNCRYFNSLTILPNDKLLKKSLDENGNRIIKKEIDWYKYINNCINKTFLSYIPYIYNFYEYGYLMNYKKESISIYTFFNNYQKQIDKIKDNNEKSIKIAEYNILKIAILKNIISKIQLLHNIETINVPKIFFLNNLKIEIFDKVINRKKKIENLLDYFDKIEIVNNLSILSFEEVLEKCKKILINYYETLDEYSYCLILGDATFSNILINPENISEITFIDPRGYFGDSNIHGPIEYDYAKIYYSLSGYDSFNNEYFIIKSLNKEKKSLDIEINPIYIDKKILNYYFNKIHETFRVIIWLSLAEYCKNDLWKCLSAFYYGLYLGTIL